MLLPIVDLLEFANGLWIWISAWKTHILHIIVKIPGNRNLLWSKLPTYWLIILHVSLTFETCDCYIDNAKQSRKSNKVQPVIIIIVSNN